MVKVKICGITSIRDAEAAVELGADALGFIFAPSPRQVTPKKAGEIIRAVSPFVKTVGVFVDENPERIRAVVDSCGLDLIQLHGNETPRMCEDFFPLTIKAFRLKEGSSLQEIPSFRGHVRAVLLDTYQAGLMGGTGKTFNWDLAVQAAKTGIPCILSGGLGPFNIEEALKRVNPAAVDVNSGVERQPGKKSLTLMKALIRTVRNLDMGGMKHA